MLGRERDPLFSLLDRARAAAERDDAELLSLGDVGLEGRLLVEGCCVASGRISDIRSRAEGRRVSRLCERSRLDAM